MGNFSSNGASQLLMEKFHFQDLEQQVKNVNWLSLIIPKDASLVKEYLIKFKEKSHIPSALEIFEKNSEYYELRYESSINWIENNNHAVISNGPFYLESYSPESRTITVNSFDDETYPVLVGHWSEFENTKIPKIMKAEIPDIVNKESEFEMNIQTLKLILFCIFFQIVMEK